MEFRILGPLEVWHDGRPLSVAGTRQRELLAILLLHSGRVVSADRLMDEMWGESQPAAGSTALRVRVSNLRRTLGAGGELLITRPPGYALLVGPEDFDLRRFERHLEQAADRMRSGDPAAALEHARAGLDLFRGAPLADFAYAAFAQPAIMRLEELRAAAFEVRVEAELALGRHAGVVAELQELVAAHPLRERLWAHLMLALYRDGRQAEALAAYRSARHNLVEEIGIEPGPELQTLEARILSQDPELAGPRPVVAPRGRRSVLALVDPRSPTGVLAIAERLAAAGKFELLAVALVDDPADVGAATACLNALRAAASSRGLEAHAVAFTSTDPGADAVRLAAEQDAAVLVVELPEDALSSGAIAGDFKILLTSAVCDVVAVAGTLPDELPSGPVLVPFAGTEHDWSAAEIGAWLAAGSPLRLLGVTGRGGRDASRLLGSASLALQRGMRIGAEPLLVKPGADAVIAAASDVTAVAAGLSERWLRDGIGAARLELARRAPCPVLLVRHGVRPGGLAPPAALTRFTWSGGG